MKNYTKQISVLVLAMGLGLSACAANAVTDMTSLDLNGVAASPTYGAGASFSDTFGFTVGTLADYNNPNLNVTAAAGMAVQAALSSTAGINISNFSLYDNQNHLITASTNMSSLVSGALTNGIYTLDVTGTSSNPQGAYNVNVFAVSAVPEPGEWALMASGLGLFGFIATRRSKVKQDA